MNAFKAVMLDARRYQYLTGTHLPIHVLDALRDLPKAEVDAIIDVEIRKEDPSYFPA